MAATRARKPSSRPTLSSVAAELSKPRVVESAKPGGDVLATGGHADSAPGKISPPRNLAPRGDEQQPPDRPHLVKHQPLEGLDKTDKPAEPARFLPAAEMEDSRSRWSDKPVGNIAKRTPKMNALADSESRYRRLFETAQDGILILNAKTGLISDVNPFLVKLLDYSREEFLGKALWQIGLFKDIEASKAAFRELQDKKYVRYEDLPLKTKGGRPINVEFVSNVYGVNGKKVIQCNIRDITKRKYAEQVEQQLQQVEKMEAIG